MTLIRLGDNVIFFDCKTGRKQLVKIQEPVCKVRGIGLVPTAELIKLSYYKRVNIRGRDYIVLPPSVSDLLSTIPHKTQTIKLKDAAIIITQCNLQPGARVVEVGTGSGALTIVLATAVGIQGRVITYELRKEHLEFAKKNLESAGLLDTRIQFKLADGTAEITECDIDAIIFDIPNPWEGISQAYQALKYGGYFCSYSPTTNQVELTVRTLRNYEFIDIRTIELLEREWVVSHKPGGGIRPSFEMLGHTGYLTFARKI